MIVLQPLFAGTWVQRAIRDGMATAAPGGGAIPVDVEPLPATRAIAIAGAVPRLGALTGLAALWVWDGGRVPSLVEVAVPKGANPDRPPSWSWPWRCVTATATVTGASMLAGVRIASRESAAAAALARAPLSAAIPACMAVVPMLDQRAVSTAIAALTPAASRRRAASAWEQILCVRSADALRP